MASVGREPEGLAKGIEKAITDPGDIANTATVVYAITEEKVVGNVGISGTVTDPKPTGKHAQ